MEEFLAVMLFIQSVALGLAAYQLRKLTEIFLELAERIDKWDEAMRAMDAFSARLSRRYSRHAPGKDAGAEKCSLKVTPQLRQKLGSTPRAA